MIKLVNDYNKKGGTIMKKISKVLMSMILLMSLGLWQTSDSAQATELPKCTMTIESDRHNDKNNVFAQASGPCKGLVEGYYAVAANVFHIVGMASYPVTKNGQTFKVGISTDPWDAELTVYTVLKTVKEEPKTEPIKSEPVKEQPKTEQPKTEQPMTEQPKTEQPKTQPVTTTQPKTQTAPKQETKTTTKPVVTQPKTTTSTTPKSETTTKTTNASQQKSTETSKTDSQKVAVASNSAETEKENENKEEVKEEVADEKEDASDASKEDEGGEKEKDIEVVEKASGEIASETTETDSSAVWVILGLLAMIMTGAAIWFFKFRKVR